MSVYQHLCNELKRKHQQENARLMQYQEGINLLEKAQQHLNCFTPAFNSDTCHYDGPPAIEVSCEIGTIMGPRGVIRGIKNFVEVLPVLEWLEDNGVTWERSEDWALILRRTYFGEYKDNIIIIMVFISEDNATCKRIQTGSEPRYEFVCS